MSPIGMSRTTSQSQARFVAVEHGGQWSPKPCHEGARDLILLVQQADESAAAFACRCIRKVMRAKAEGIGLASALLVVAPGFDLARLESRCAIARTVGSELTFEPGT